MLSREIDFSVIVLGKAMVLEIKAPRLIVL
jgi:hypothetical protein